MAYSTWKTRLRVIVQRFAQPTCACMVCMTAPSFVNLISLPHWKIALQTGLGTGILALLLSFTPIGRLFSNRYGNALVMGALTAVADYFSHPGRFEIGYGEALLTGVVSGAARARDLVPDRGSRAARSRRLGARATGASCRPDCGR
jgi:hypothetical protein